MKSTRARLLLTIAAVAVGASFTGCSGSHYRVTDVSTGEVYYTKNVKRQHGSVEFQNAENHSTVTLPASEVQSISKKDFHKALEGGH